jgi:glutamate/tyrosine decarboxylase-like PLP-dependent enzyme
MDNDKKRNSITIRQSKDKKMLLAQLSKMPILQIACERSGIGRSTYYRWRDEDEEFKKLADESIAQGEALITDLTESQLISLIKEKHFPAVQLWLRQHHPKYSTKVELSGKITTENEPLTPEQEELITQALKLAGVNDEGYESKQLS